MLRVMIAVLSGIVVASGSPAFGQAAQPGGAEPARRPSSTKPTPEAKINTLKPLPLSIVGMPWLWTYDDSIEGKPIEQGEVAAIGDGLVTIRDGDKYFDIVTAELGETERSTIERMKRLLENQGTDEERGLLGSWSLYLPEDDKEPPPDSEPRLKLVISGSVIHLGGGSPDQYRLDTTKNPKVIDSTFYRGIFELKSGWLRVRFAVSSSDPPPKSFEGKDETANDTLIFRPLPDVKSLPPAKDFDPELKGTLEELVKLLEAEKYDDFMERAIPPQALKSIPADKRDEMKRYVAAKKDRTLAMFQALLRVSPKISADGSSADFDFSRIHVDGIGAVIKPKAVKADGKWYLAGP